VPRVEGHALSFHDGLCDRQHGNGRRREFHFSTSFVATVASADAVETTVVATVVAEFIV